MRLRDISALAVTLMVLVGSGHAETQEQSQRPWRSSGMPADRDERLEISAFVGGAQVGGTLGPSSNIYMNVTSTPGNVDLGELFGLRASWAFTKNVVVEGNFSRAENPYTLEVFDFVLGGFDLGEQFEAKHTAASVNLVVQFPTAIGLVPYGTGGLGYLKTSAVQGPIGDSDSASGLETNFGGGVKYFFPTPRWLGVRFDVRYRRASEGVRFHNSASPSSTEFTIGAMARFF